MNAYDNIVNNVISQYNNSFLTSLKHLNETKILVDDWRGKIAVKLENRREAIRRFQANIQKYDTSLPIVMRTLESCDKSFVLNNTVVVDDDDITGLNPNDCCVLYLILVVSSVAVDLSQNDE